MTRPDLTALQVVLDPPSGHHQTVQVRSILDPWDNRFDDIPDDEFCIAQLHAAGVLARLAVRALPVIEQQQRLHRCCVPAPPAADDYCTLRAFGPGMEQVWGEGPSVYMTINPEYAQALVDYVKIWLREIADENALKSFGQLGPKS